MNVTLRPDFLSFQILMLKFCCLVFLHCHFKDTVILLVREDAGILKTVHALTVNFHVLQIFMHEERVFTLLVCLNKIKVKIIRTCYYG